MAGRLIAVYAKRRKQLYQKKISWKGRDKARREKKEKKKKNRGGRKHRPNVCVKKWCLLVTSTQRSRKSEKKEAALAARKRQ